MVNQYRYWTEQADLGSFYVGIDKAWVYPIVALVPMILAGTFGFGNYASTWLALVFVLDAVAFAVLVGWRRPSRPVALGWWWIAFLLLLGPIALGRIDSISVPVAIVAVLMLAARPRLAAFLLTIATWIKVWPAALIAAAIIASRARVRILVTAVLTSVVIVAVRARPRLGHQRVELHLSADFARAAGGVAGEHRVDVAVVPAHRRFVPVLQRGPSTRSR